VEKSTAFALAKDVEDWEVADRYLDAVERDLPRRLLELPGAQ
jgi:hypothetical protein